MPPRRAKAAAAPAEPAPATRDRPTRAAASAKRAPAKARVPSSSDEEEEEEEEEDEEDDEESSSEEDVKPVIKGRGGRASGRSSAASTSAKPPPTKSNSARSSARQSNASAASASTSRSRTSAPAKPPAKAKPAARASAATSTNKATVVESDSDQESQANNASASEEEEMGDDDVESEPSPAPKSRSRRRAGTVESSPAPVTGPSDVKPLVRGRGKKRISLLPPRESSEEGEEEEEAAAAVGDQGEEEEEEGDENDEEEEEELRPKTPVKKGKGRRVVASSEDEDEGEGDEVEAPAPAQALAADEETDSGSEAEVAADLGATPTRPRVKAEEVEPTLDAADEDEEAEITNEPMPIKKDETPAPSQATTGFDLAAAARMAALNHAAREKEREREREGKPRLVIHQMVLEDFKSYRGRGIIGPFHKSFSAVVGPNGSGKSNTIDALLFVFGYRATKMRQGKLSELIHNSGAAPAPEETDEDGVGMPARAPAMDGGDAGEYDSDQDSDAAYTNKKKGKKGKGKKSAAEPAQAGLIDSCTVEVWFREIIDLPGRDEFTIVPDSQLVVARTAYRNNSSKYTINGKTSTFTEVTTLLKGRGIDLQHKRFLILQGEVESIAQMKPKGVTEHDEGLLEYLEDIIGTSEYKPDIEAAVVEVDRLNEERAVQLNRVKLVEREKSSLEGRKKECDSYLKDQNELAHNQSALFQVNIHQASLNAQVATEAVTEAQAALEEETEAQADIRKEADDLQAEYDTLVADLKSVEKETAEVVKQLAALDKTDVQLQERKKSSSAKIKKLKKAITDDTHARSEAATWVTNHGETITRVGAELTKMEVKLEAEEAELDKVREGLKGKTEVFTAQIDTLQAELQPWASKVAEKQAEIDLVVNERDLLTERGESVRAGIEEAEATLERLTADREAKHEILAQLAGEKKDVKSGLRKLEGQLNQSQAQDQQLRSKVSAARSKFDEARASQSASRSQNNVLNSLTKLSQQGRLPGFYGRLGNLGRIDDRYDVAISTACPGLDNLVTDNVRNGQACIEYLRKNDLGRATIMCIESIQRRDMSRIQTPENAPRLFDLVTPKEPKYAALFFHLLTNTLVANDLDQGNRLAFGGGNRRWRVVTLDGQLIETSGAMSGGGGRPQRGRMSNKIAPDEVSPELVARFDQEQRVASEELRVFTEDRAKIERELQNLQRRLPEIETTISKVEMDLNTGTKRAEEAKHRLAELQGQSKPEAGEEQRIAQLDKQAKSLNKELVKLQDETQSIESKIKVLQEKILEVGGVKLRTQQSKVQDLKAQIDLATDRLTKAEVGMAKSEKDAAKLAKTIETNQASLETTEADLAELNEQIANGSADSDLVRTSVEQAQAVLDEKKDDLGEMKKVLDEKVAVIVQFKKRELELKQTLESERKVLKENEKLVKYWSEKLGDLQLNEIDEDDDEDDEANPEATPKPAKADTVLREWTASEIAHLDLKVVTAKIAALEERIAKTNLDLSVLKEYARREKEFMQRAADLDAVTKERDGAKQLADDLRAKRLREFMEGFGIISMKLKEMYQMITLGGNAELELVDSLDPFSEGIIFSVMPPKKSWKNISNLSGGEKTLSSLALVFALHVFKPTPLYFMDEIDAALDFRNVSIVANYIRDRTKQAQFVVISLRNNMFELSSRLIGIYKVANQTRSVAIDNTDLHQLAITAAA